ncbi:MAG: restriction endonuclease subunit S [Balneolaceae bacterium]|nr:restriction endonuclease subunit S [Balneolaceae bacterium]
MSSEWPEYTVQQLVDDKILAKPKDGNHGSIHPKSSDYVDSGVPFIMATDMIDNGVDFMNCKFITEEMAASLRKGFAKTGDVLLSHKATIGRTSILQDHPFSTVVLTPQVTYYRVLDEEVLNNKYLHYYFKSEGFQNLFNSWAGGGSTRAYLGITDQRKLPITVPPIDLQRDIARILGDLDQKIHLNQQTNETLEAMAQAIFKSWFVDFDPVRAKMEAMSAGRDPNRAAMAAIAGVSLENDWYEIEVALEQKLSRMSDNQRTQLHKTAELFPVELVESEIGMVPKGWKIDSVFNQAKYINGTAFKGKDFSKLKTGLPVIKIAELKSGITDQTKFTEKNVDVKYHIDSGDVLFSWSGNPDTSIDIFIWEGGSGLLNQHIFKVESESNTRKVFNYYFLKSMLPFFKRTAANKQTTGLGHVTQKDLKRKQVAIPSKELINCFAIIAEPIFDKVFSNLMETQNLSKLRDTLLPKLISGEVGV